MPKSKKFKRKKSWLSPRWQASLPLAGMILLVWGCAAVAQNADNTLTLESLKVGLDTMWVMFAGCLVFFMNAGFAMLETGFCRQKNAVNVLSKNLIVFALSTIAYWAVGFALMFGQGNPLSGTEGWFLFGADNSLTSEVFSSLDDYQVPLYAKFFFHLVFAGTAATIVSGAVAERLKFLAFLIFSPLLAGISYAVTGHWIWGGGWLQQLGFWDFAGSTVVHSVGGWAALFGVALLGPRAEKYDENNRRRYLPGHNLSISALGCLILWLGWFGFNPGSTMAADPKAITHILVTTNMAAATGGIAATFTSWLWVGSSLIKKSQKPVTLANLSKFGKSDLTMTINGVLAGLVAITASCRFVAIGSAACIGLIAGILVVFCLYFLEIQRIDDPVGAVSVHLFCGIWGTLAVALFSEGPGNLYNLGDGPVAGLFRNGGIDALRQLSVQFLGIALVGLFTIAFSLIVWTLINSTVGLKVSDEVQRKGLDIEEHGFPAYSGFGRYVSQASYKSESSSQQGSSEN